MDTILTFLHNPAACVAIGFLIFVGLAVWKVFPQLGKSLDSYSAKIGAELAQAEQLKAEAEKLLAEARKKSKSIERDAKEILERAKFDAKLIADEAEKEIEHEIEYKMQLAEEKIARARDAAVEHVRTKAVEIAIASATKTLSEEFATRDNSERLIEKSLRLISSDM